METDHERQSTPFEQAQASPSEGASPMDGLMVVGIGASAGGIAVLRDQIVV